MKWRLFAMWCSYQWEDPRRCTVGPVLSFLQEGLEKRLSAFTLKVYMAAIAENHDMVKLNALSMKIALLTALTFVKRVGDLKALFISDSCLEFGLA